MKIQATAPVLAGSNNAAFRQTVSMVSWASSSAVAAPTPDRSMKAFIRGAKYSNSPQKRRGPDLRDRRYQVAPSHGV